MKGITVVLKGVKYDKAGCLDRPYAYVIFNLKEGAFPLVVEYPNA